MHVQRVNPMLDRLSVRSVPKAMTADQKVGLTLLLAAVVGFMAPWGV